MTSENPPVTYLALREVAEDVAKLAADHIREKIRELGYGLDDTVQLKSSDVDPVTAVDQAAESFIVDRILAARPHDGVIGEEGDAIASSSGIGWIIDPVDGTVNLLYGIPQYAVSIAAAHDGQVVAGAVINVATGRLFSAHRGGGATVRRDDGGVTALACHNPSHLAVALVATGFSYQASRRVRQAGIVSALIPHIRDIRRMGAAALDLCAVAEGALDAYYEHGINSWDYAAGLLIAAEAGAHVSAPALDISGQEGVPVIAVAPAIAREFMDLAERLGISRPMPQ